MFIGLQHHISSAALIETHHFQVLHSQRMSSGRLQLHEKIGLPQSVESIWKKLNLLWNLFTAICMQIEGAVKS
jgi:intracellular septation protein A